LGLCASLQVLHHALAVPCLVGGDTGVGVCHAEAESLIEEDRELAHALTIQGESYRLKQEKKAGLLGRTPPSRT
jgi:hypothetical protein